MSKHEIIGMTAPRPHNIAELLYHWPLVRLRQTNPWAKQFADSLWKQSFRKGWQPTEKQERLMRQMVGELFAPRVTDDFDVIE